jgi:hypothetical protein
MWGRRRKIEDKKDEVEQRKKKGKREDGKEK